MIKMKLILRPDPKLSLILNIKDGVILFGRIVVQCHGQSFLWFHLWTKSKVFLKCPISE